MFSFGGENDAVQVLLTVCDIPEEPLGLASNVQKGSVLKSTQIYIKIYVAMSSDNHCNKTQHGGLLACFVLVMHWTPSKLQVICFSFNLT